MPGLFKSCHFLMLVLVALAAGPALADDIEGSSDHPLVGRYDGASIVYYKASDYDEATLLKAPLDYGALLDAGDTKDHSGPSWLKAEGKVTQIRYDGPEGRSSLEILKNFENSLKKKGFKEVFSCADKACFTGKLQDPYLMGEQIDPTNGLSTAYFDHARYTLAKLNRDEGAVYAMILVGESQQQLTTFVEVVETQGMEGDKIVFLNADEMDQAIEESGRVSLYGILFDFDKATLKDESKPTLDEIAKLLKSKPELKLDIVGHTDNQGGGEYNMDLSRRRAASVVDALTNDYDIEPERLTSSGAGMTEPVASNDTDEGRAKNRRVELVAQ